MYYSSPFPPKKPRTAYNAGHALREFNFLPLRDGRHLAFVRALVAASEKLSGENPTPLSKNVAVSVLFDFAAALFGHLTHRGYLRPRDVLREANEFFHQTIVQSGYSLILPPFNAVRGGTGEAVEVIVPGAQTGRIFQARIDACIRMLAELSPPEVNITFTGANPGHPSAQIPNEAEDMAQYFHERAKKIPSSVKWNVHIENRANNTRQNLERTVEQWRIRHAGTHGLREASAITPIHCIIVSSLFHLPRLIQDATVVFQGETVSRLSFVSSQNSISEIERTALDERARYVKSCTHEFLLLLLAHKVTADDDGYGPVHATEQKWKIEVEKIQPLPAAISAPPTSNRRTARRAGQVHLKTA